MGLGTTGLGAERTRLVVGGRITILLHVCILRDILEFRPKNCHLYSLLFGKDKHQANGMFSAKISGLIPTML